VTVPALPGGAAHPGRQEGHLEDVRRPEPGVSDARARRAALAPPSLRDGRIEAALRSLELTVRGRLDGLLQGNHLGLVPGPGSEPGEARIYQPGDDVRRMDWAVTARTTLPHVRQTVADRELETWVVLDLSPSLDFGTASCEKRDLAVAALAAVTHLTAGGGNRSAWWSARASRRCGSRRAAGWSTHGGCCAGWRAPRGRRRVPAATSRPRSRRCAGRRGGAGWPW